jgi:hypothetical protein
VPEVVEAQKEEEKPEDRIEYSQHFDVYVSMVSEK